MFTGCIATSVWNRDLPLHTAGHNNATSVRDEGEKSLRYRNYSEKVYFHNLPIIFYFELKKNKTNL